MVNLQALQLLLYSAREYQQQIESISRQEIVAKVNQIKYLSEQKKTPPFVLRKEIACLEQQIGRIFELEKKLAQGRKRESEKVQTLKKQASYLKRKLAVAEDKELPKKVERLSHMLGDVLAKCGTAEDIQRSKEIIGEAKTRKIKISCKKVVPMVNSQLAFPSEEKIKQLQQKLNWLKQQVIASPNAAQLQDKISLIEAQLQKYLPQQEAEVQIVPSGEIKHDFLFTIPAQSSSDIDDELPLPPPPRIVKS